MGLDVGVGAGVGVSVSVSVGVGVCRASKRADVLCVCGRACML